MPPVPPFEFDIVARHAIPAARDPRMATVTELGRAGADSTPLIAVAAGGSHGALSEKTLLRAMGTGGPSERSSHPFRPSPFGATMGGGDFASALAAAPLPTRVGWVFWTLTVGPPLSSQVRRGRPCLISCLSHA